AIWLSALFCCGALFADDQASEINVNSRYIVESVEIGGGRDAKISEGLREQIQKLVGERLNPANLDDLAKLIRKELHVKSVVPKLQRGDQPEHIKVVFEVKPHEFDLDISVPKFVYNSREGWSANV